MMYDRFIGDVVVSDDDNFTEMVHGNLLRPKLVYLIQNKLLAVQYLDDQLEF